MNAYRNLSGRSGVRAYQAGTDCIEVAFADGSVYRYTQASAGSEAIAQMRNLAEAGRGLNGYINRYVRERYAERLR